MSNASDSASSKHSLRGEYCLSLLDALKSRVVLASAVFLIVIAFFGGHTIRSIAVDTVRQNLAREAAHFQAALDVKLKDLRLEASNIGNARSLREAIAGSPEALQRLGEQIDTTAFRGEKPRRVGIVNTRGQVVVSNDSSDNTLSDQWMEAGLTGRDYMDFSIHGMKLSLPIRTQGEVSGAVFVDISRKDVDDLFNIKPAYGEVVALFKNYPITFSDNSLYLEFLDSKNFSSKTISYNLKSSAFSDVTTVMLIRENITLENSERISFVIWMLALLSLFAVYFTTFHVVHEARKKSKKLSTAIDTVSSAQDLGNSVEIEAGFGLSVAISSLNEMFKRLQGNVVSIDVLNEREETRKRAEQEIRYNEAKTQTILNAVSEGIITVDEGGIIRSLNTAAAELFGCTDVDRVIGTHLGAFIPDAARFFTGGWGNRLEETADGVSQSHIPDSLTEHLGLREDSTTFPLELSFSQMQLSGRTMFTGILRNISERKQSEQKMIEMAYSDHLTGLLNRRSFPEEIDRLIEKVRGQDKMLAVLMLDLDRFKGINDCLGQRVGDDLLKLVAHKLQTITGKGDLLARLGGDEFAVASICSSKSEANDIADRILAATNSKVSISGFDVHLRTSIGVSLFPDDTVNAEELLRDSDLALSRAKSMGCGIRSFFTKEMAEEIESKSRLEIGLRSAISDDSLEIHFQPQFDLKSSRLVGAEALVRWTHPVHGIVSPAKFIPLAEERGLIAQIGKMVLLESCFQGAKWADVGISVNLSPAQFIYDDIVGLVSDAIRQSGIAPDRLTLEITEGLFLKDDKMISQQLFDLKMLGVNLSLDDFGTGYSSLGYLTRLPIDEIKIDKSFVSQINLKKGAEIIKGLVGLSQSLGLTLVAEGVETSQQMQFLKEIGCDICQGFLMGRPVCPADFEDIYITENEARIA